MNIKVKDLSPKAKSVKVVKVPSKKYLTDYLVNRHYEVAGADEDVNIYAEGAVESVLELLMEENDLDYSSKLHAKAEELVDSVVDEVVATIQDMDADARESYEEYNEAMKGEY